MILADTSVWVNHLRANDPILVSLLDDNQVVMHLMVIGCQFLRIYGLPANPAPARASRRRTTRTLPPTSRRPDGGCWRKFQGERRCYDGAPKQCKTHCAICRDRRVPARARR